MERYKILNPVGDGAFGVVYRAINTATGEIFAIKKLKKLFKTWDECLSLREIKSLSKLNNQYIVKLKEAFRFNDELHLVFEYMDQNAYELIKDRTSVLPESQIKTIISQVLQGLAYMHKRGFFHRDLKPENLMISGSTCKITDFGLAREIRSKPPFTDYISTRWYRAPEILLRSTTYSSPVDLFALGCIMAELYMLRPLAAGADEYDQLYKLSSVLGPPDLSAWSEGARLASAMGYSFVDCEGVPLEDLMPNASPAAIELMNALLQWDPKRRPTAAECLSFRYFDIEEPKHLFFDNSDLRSSKWSNGSSKIIGTSSKGKWSFHAAENKEVQIGMKEIEIRQSRKKFEKFASPRREFFPPILRLSPSRKVSRERVGLLRQEIVKETVRTRLPKLLTNPPKLPPITGTIQIDKRNVHKQSPRRVIK